MSAGSSAFYIEPSVSTNSKRLTNESETDFAPLHSHVKYFDIFMIIFSIFTHVVDVVFDIYLAFRYYNSGRTLYCAMTLVVTLFPAFVNTVVSIRMYVMDNDKLTVTKRGTSTWVCRIFVLVFQLAPLLRYCDMLKYALKCRQAEKDKNQHKQRTYYKLMLKEDADIALLRLFECFLEAAPQQLLQISILLLDASEFAFRDIVFQVLSIVTSHGSMAWSLASYQRSIRFAQSDKDNISIIGSVMLFFWHFLVTVSRILSISLIASEATFWTLLSVSVHWLFMTVWTTVMDRPNFCVSSKQSACGQQSSQFLFSALLGLVYIFTYFTPSEGQTKVKFAVYYTVIFFENCVSITLWSQLVKPEIRSQWYYLFLILLSFISFLVGIVFMLIYYKFFHPKKIAALKRTTSPTENVSVQCDIDTFS